MDFNGVFNSIIKMFFIAGLLIGLLVWGVFGLVNYYFGLDVLKSKTIIKPKIELIIENNKVDTLYIYENNN